MLSALLFSVIAITTVAAQQVKLETPVSTQLLAELNPYIYFTKATYCPPWSLSDWTCGPACSALPGFQPSLAGGDGNLIQIYFVGYWPDRDTVVVGHEGTDPLKFLSVYTDFDPPLVPLNPLLFPGVFSGVLVHEGFRDAQARTALRILAEVRKLFKAHNINKLTLVGHSLGGAIAELDSLFFSLNVPNISIETVTYGTPRVGNVAFAQLIDTHIPNFIRVNNKRDPVPTVPPQSLGFFHPHGEIHIISSQKAVACPGDDDATDPDCTMSTVPTILSGNILDHLGPYDGVYIGSIFCI